MRSTHILCILLLLGGCDAAPQATTSALEAAYQGGCRKAQSDTPANWQVDELHKRYELQKRRYKTKENGQDVEKLECTILSTSAVADLTEVQLSRLIAMGGDDLITPAMSLTLLAQKKLLNEWPIEVLADMLPGVAPTYPFRVSRYQEFAVMVQWFKRSGSADATTIITSLSATSSQADAALEHKLNDMIELSTRDRVVRFTRRLDPALCQDDITLEALMPTLENGLARLYEHIVDTL